MKTLSLKDLKKVVGGSGDRNGDGPKVARALQYDNKAAIHTP
ncbi:hypothetical protein [Pseudoalteromonas aurantia]|nr:hypothetical protein [Pseudoalteromonas aurantia]